MTGTLAPDGLYRVDMPGDVAHVAPHKLWKLEMLHIWLGHLNYQDIQKLIQSGLLDGICITTSELNEESPKCLLCALGKSTCASFSSSNSQCARSLFIVISFMMCFQVPPLLMRGSLVIFMSLCKILIMMMMIPSLMLVLSLLLYLLFLLPIQILMMLMMILLFLPLLLLSPFLLHLLLLHAQKTSELVPLPPGHKAIGSKWVMNLKFNEFGDVSSHRTHVVAQGYSQQPGVDYFPMEIFAPVAQIASVCDIASYAPIKDFEIPVIDVKSAFLNSKMPDNQKLCVKQPPGFAEPGKEVVAQGPLWSEASRSSLV
jgi:hypothetical protein